MEFSFKGSTLFLAILLTGLSAGLFYAWEVSVIPGNKRLSDRSYVEAMQAINRAILNPAFYAIFFGSLVFLFLHTYAQVQDGISIGFYLMLAASLSYLIGTFGITIFGNVPLNEGLDLIQVEDLAKEALSKVRRVYESKWNTLHSIRTLFAVLSFLLSLLVALLNTKDTISL